MTGSFGSTTPAATASGPRSVGAGDVALWRVATLALAGVAWLALLRQPNAHHPSFIRSACLWLLMTGAMMLPTTLPWLSALTLIRREHPTRDRLLFLAGYGLVCLGFSVAMAGAQQALSLMLMDPHAPPNWVVASTLAAAGAYQFTTIKRACLRHCRSPFAYVLSSWRPDWRWAPVVGIRHGLICLGCCWALMVLQLVTGVVHGPAMVGLTAVVVAEQASPWGQGVARLTGVVLLLAAAVLLVRA